MTMVFRIFDQIVTSASVWLKKVKCWNFEDVCAANATTGKVATWGGGGGGGSYLFMKYGVFIQDADFC